MFSALVAEQVTSQIWGTRRWSRGRFHEFEKAGECPPVNMSRKAGSGVWIRPTEETKS